MELPTFVEGQEVLAEDLNVVSNGVRNFSEFVSAKLAANVAIPSPSVYVPIVFDTFGHGETTWVTPTGIRVPRAGVYHVETRIQTGPRAVTFNLGRLATRLRIVGDSVTVLDITEVMGGTGGTGANSNGPDTVYMEAYVELAAAVVLYCEFLNTHTAATYIDAAPTEMVVRQMG